MPGPGDMARGGPLRMPGPGDPALGGPFIIAGPPMAGEPERGGPMEPGYGPGPR